MVRISWRRQQPRSLRVELTDPSAAELLVLSSADHKTNDTNEVQICLELPWKERQARKLSWKDNANSGDQSRSLIIHGIPEPNNQFPRSHIQQEWDQWNYIRNRLGLSLEQVTACKLHRIPRPIHLSSIKAPRLLRITLATNNMRHTTLTAWESLRNLFPSEIRLHPDQPRSLRRAVKRPLQVCLPTVIVAPPNEIPNEKNAPGPAQ